MKKIKLSYVAFSFMVLAVTACTQAEDATLSLTDSQINAAFTVTNIQTRVNTLDEHGTTWEDGDQIKVEVSTEYETAAPGTVAFDGNTNSWIRNGSFKWINSHETHTILASTSLQEQDSYASFSLPNEQNSLQGLKKADLINGRWYGEWSNIINIPMSHRMSLITINYVLGSAEYDADATLENPTILSQYSTAEFNKETGYMTPSGGELSVQAYQYEQDGVHKLSAIIIPCSLETTDKFLTFSLNGSEHVAHLKSTTKFEEGCRYTYELKIGKNKVELTQTSVGDLSGWDVDKEEELK